MERRESVKYLVTIAVGGLFVCSGLLKLFAFREFVAAVDAYAILPEVLVSPFAFGVLLAELALGLLLIIDRFTAPAAALLAWLVLLFLAAMGIASLQGRAIDCGCLPGIGRERLGGWSWLRDALLFFLLVGIVRWRAVRGEDR
jgi:uncharacterized membrane protein YphA (DoxX/SURF4 family)